MRPRRYAHTLPPPSPPHSPPPLPPPRSALGAGKTVFARGFVRGATAAPHAAVTSPTYLLDNAYVSARADLRGALVHHMDLYRLQGPADAASLSLPAIFRNDVAIVEWPQRLLGVGEEGALEVVGGGSGGGGGGGALPAEYLLVRISAEGEPDYPARPAGAVWDGVMHGGPGHHGGHVPAPGGGAPGGEPLGRPPPVELLEDTAPRAIELVPVGGRYAALLEAAGLVGVPPARQLR